MQQPKLQRGFLLLAAVILIVIVSLLGGAIAYMFSGSATSGAKYLQSKQALYIAESGLQRGRYAFTATGADKVSCNNFSTTLANVPFGQGTFSLSCSHYNPTSASLNTSINSSVTTIPLSSSTGFAPQGRATIESEKINYSGISGNSLISVTRGADGTSPANHSSGVSVTQNQYIITSTGKVGTIIGGIIPNPEAQKTVKQNMSLSQSVWAVGTNGAIYQYDGSSWNLIADSPTTPNTTFNDISLLSDMSIGFIVGDEANNIFTIYMWNGSSWIPSPGVPSPSADYLKNLLGASTVSANDAWAVGEAAKTGHGGNQTARYTMLHWNGSSWCLIDSSDSQNCGYTIPGDDQNNEDLNKISVVPGSTGFAVGDDGTILKLNGTAWLKDPQSSSITNKDLNDVITISSNEAWAVGDHGVLLKWNGSTWSPQSSGVTNAITSIDMVDSNGDGHANSGIATTSGNKYFLIYGCSGGSCSWSGDTFPQGHNNQTAGTEVTPGDYWVATKGGWMCHYLNGDKSCEQIGHTILGIETGGDSIPTYFLWSETVN